MTENTQKVPLTIPTISLSDWRPEFSIQFRAADNYQIGKLEWNDGILKFSGEIDESAKIFLRYLATLGGLQIDLPDHMPRSLISG